MKTIKNEKQFADWFKKNYGKLGYDKIVRGDISRFPEFIMLRNGKEIRVELETISSNFIAHKHDYDDVDEIVCLVKDVELEKPVFEVKELKYEGKRKVTLSIESKIYDDFKKFCDENAVMLSKKVENVMKELMKKKFVFFGFALLIFLTFFASSALFQDISQGDFNNGTYVNTTHNGTGVALVGGNLSGIFTSRVFDATSNSLWKNISYSGNQSFKDILYAIDNQAAVWKSIDEGINWTQLTSDYTGPGEGNGITYLAYNLNGTLFAVYSQDVWTSNNGINWTKVNDDFNPGDASNEAAMAIDENNYMYIIDTSEDVYKSTDSGASFSLINGSFKTTGTQNSRGLTSTSSGLYSVHADAEVWKSTNQGVTWTRTNSDYNGAIGNEANDIKSNSSGAIFIVHNQDLWNSINDGVNWTLVNDDFNDASSANARALSIDKKNFIYIIDGNEDVYKSTDSGASFSKIASNINGANGFINGLVSFRATSQLSFQARNCSLSSCADGTWQNVNPDNINLSGRYFQYLTTFSRQDSVVMPILFNVSLGYTILDSIPPQVTISFPSSGEYYNTLPLNFNVSLNENGSVRYSLDSGAHNVSMNSIDGLTFNATNSSIAEGNYVFRVYANDTAGNVNYNSSVNFGVDTTNPSIIILFPQNTSYSSGNILINYTAIDSLSGVQACWYNIDGFPSNQSLLNCGTTSISVGDGSHSLIVYVNDSAGNMNLTSVTFSVDSTPPQWSGLQESVPAVYSNLNLGYFNVTWSDSGGIVSVLFESNFSGVARNYTMYSLGGGVYGFNASLPAGGFYWKSYATDSMGTLNSTPIQSLSVAKAGNAVYLYLNGNLNSNLSINYSTQSNATATSEVGGVSLSRDLVFVANPEVKVLAANSIGYFYNASVAESQNYSGNSSAYYLFVDKLNSSVSLLLSGGSSDLSIGYGVQTNATAVVGGYYSAVLYRDGIQVANPEISILGVGYYNYTAAVLDDENISGSSISFFVNVSKASAILNLEVNGSANDLITNYGGVINTSGFETMSGDSDVVYSFYKNGLLVGTGSLVSDSGIFGVGEYEYIFNSSGGQNYSEASVSRKLNITKASVDLSLSLNGVSENTSQIYGNESSIAGNISASGMEIELLKDGVSVLSGNSNLNYTELLAAGIYNFTLVFEGNENYSSAAVGRFLSVERAEPLLLLHLNGFSSDISSPAGNVVTINATSLRPSPWEISLYEDGVFVDSGSGFVNIERNYSVLGDRVWTAEILESQNYSALNLSRILSVIDPNSPQFSILTVSPASNAQYLNGRTYRFNATWTDNVAIDSVVFDFEGVNYSSSSGQVQKAGDVYSISLSDLGVGSYYYRWSANDSSGNFVQSPQQTYIVKQAPTSLVISISPSQTVSYGAITSVTCLASNNEAVPQIIRDVTPISILPDSGIFGVGSYTYFCTSAASQNFSAGSAIPATLTVQKALPQFNLTLNGAASDLFLPSSGGSVNISASLVAPLIGEINLSVDGIVWNSGIGILLNQSVFNVVGNHSVIVSYGGNENYSAGSTTRYVVVSAPSSGGGSGGGGSGGGGGGSGGGGVAALPPEKASKDRIAKLDVIVKDVILKKGTTKNFNVEIFSKDVFFLNNCKLEFGGAAESWISSSQVKGIAKGEKFVYFAEVSAPEEGEPGNFDMSIAVQCDEGRATGEFNVVAYRNSFEPKILDYAKDGNKLRVKYEIEDYAGESHQIVLNYAMLDFDNLPRYKGTDNFRLGVREKLSREIVFELPKDSFGEFSFEAVFGDGNLEIKTDKKIFLPAGSVGLTGLVTNVGDDNKKVLVYFGVLILVVGIGVFAFYFVRKIRKSRVHFTRQKRVLLDFDAGTQHF